MLFITLVCLGFYFSLSKEPSWQFELVLFRRKYCQLIAVSYFCVLVIHSWTYQRLCFKGLSTLTHVRVSFLFMAESHSIVDGWTSLSNCWWTFGLLPPFGCYNQCCHEHLCTAIYLNTGFELVTLSKQPSGNPWAWLALCLPITSLSGHIFSRETVYSRETEYHSLVICSESSVGPEPLSR